MESSTVKALNLAKKIFQGDTNKILDDMKIDIHQLNEICYVMFEIDQYYNRAVKQLTLKNIIQTHSNVFAMVKKWESIKKYHKDLFALFPEYAHLLKQFPIMLTFAINLGMFQDVDYTIDEDEHGND